MYKLNSEATKRFTWAKKQGISITDTKQQIVAIVLEQEIVSYSDNKGTVSFDYNDLD